MKECIRINIRKNDIGVKINEESSMEEIIEAMIKKMPNIEKKYEEQKNPIRIEGKILKIKEIEEIKELFTDQLKEMVKFESPEELGLAGIKKVYEQDVEDSETRIIRGGLRSGQKLEFEGSLVVIGDVNSGAEVIASDNIIVVGTLRGLAHAGAKGNKKAIIAANTIECPQLRIANIVKELEKEDILIRKQYAYVKGEKIIIEE